MNEFKRMIHSIDKNVNSYVIAGIGALALIFTFALPMWTALGFGGRITLVMEENAFCTFLGIVNMILPVVIIVMALLKKPVTFILPLILFCTTLLLGLMAPKYVSIGVGVIFNMLLYMALTAYCFLRKDAPSY